MLLSSFDDPPTSIGFNLYPQPSSTTISPDYSRTATCVGLLDSPPPLRLALLPEPPLARPRFSLVRAPDARRHLLIGGQPQFIRLQLANLVAQPPGFLELQVRRRVAHLLFEVLDIGAQIVPDHVCRLVVADVDRPEEHTSELQSLMRTSNAV